MLLEILLVLFALGITRIFWRRWHYDLHKIPSTLDLPLIGHSHLLGTMKGDFLAILRDCYAKLGCPKIFRVSILGSTLLVVTDIDVAKNVIMSKSDPLPRKSTSALMMSLMIGNDPSSRNLMHESTLSPYVKAVRKVYSRGFQADSLKDMLPRVRNVLERLMIKIDAKRQSGPIDVQELCVQLTLDTIGEVAFETNLGGLDETGRLRKLIIAVGHLRSERRFDVLKMLHAKFVPNSSVLKRQKDLIQSLNDEWDALTKKVLEYDDPPEGKEPLWYCLRSLIIPETGSKLTFSDLRGELALLVIAGMDTTGHQLAWILGLLATHPRVVKKFRDELSAQRLHGTGAREWQFDDLGSLSYLTAIIKEGMRVASAAAGAFLRETKTDMTLLGYHIPKGTAISVPSTRAVHSDHAWGDPLVFRPERWTNEDTSEKFYLGFSFGPRDCVGQKLAMLEMKVAIIEIVKRFDMSSTVPVHELLSKTRLGVAVEAVNGVWVNISPIGSSTNCN